MISAQQGSSGRYRGGFTIVELLVALVVLAVILSITFPVVMQQIERAAAARVVRDLDHLHAGIRMFEGNVLASPKYATHLANPLETVDSALSNVEYTRRQTRNWRGPYVDLMLDEDLRVFLNHAECVSMEEPCEDAVAWRTGYSGRIQNELECFNPAMQTIVSCGSGAYTVLRVDGLTASQFTFVNDLVDPDESEDLVTWVRPGTTTELTVRPSWVEGRLRFIRGSGIDISETVGVTYYMVSPWKNW